MTAPLVLVLLLVAPSAVAAAPPNDECSAATVIKSLPFMRTLAVDGATESGDDPSSECANGPNVWFRHTARTDVSLEIDTTGSTYHASIAVFRGGCGTSTELACSHDYSDAGTQLVVLLRKGETVHIAVAGDPHADDQLTIAVRKSDPRYRSAAPLTELLRSSDPSPYGGSQGVLASCVFGIKAPGKPLTAIACTGDAVPPPVGGTIDDFESTPSGTPGDLYVVAAIDDAAGFVGFKHCLLRYRNGKASPIRCQGDPFPGGGLYEGFDPTGLGSGLVTDAAAKGLLFWTHADSFSGSALMALRRNTLVSVLTPGSTPAPVSGGVLAGVDDDDVGFTGKSVVAAIGIVGGSASSGLFRTTLP